MTSALFYPSCYFDSPKTFDASVTAIPAVSSSPIQVIANSGAAAEGMKFDDNTGAFIGVYVGGVGVERLVGIIGNGKSGVVHFPVPAGSRVCLGSMNSTAITNGTIAAYLGTRNRNQ